MSKGRKSGLLAQTGKGKLKNHFRRLRRVQGAVAIMLLVILGIFTVVTTTPLGEDLEIFAADGALANRSTAWMSNVRNASLPTGIAGLVSGVEDSPVTGTRLKRVGTSAETVVVGQRVQTVAERSPSLDLSGTVESRAVKLSDQASSLSRNATLMSDYDYENLCRIVEAEAGTEDIKGRILVANVIMNRLGHDEFPDTISDVIYHYDHGVAQFSPVSDGRIYSVTVSDETREAVRQVLAGTDYSQGALFFIQKDAADKNSLRWFEKNLKHLFKYGVHEFYTYP